MSLTVTDHGAWVQYRPEVMPSMEFAGPVPPGMAPLFAKRAIDGIDWYDFANGETRPWPPSALVVTLATHPTDGLVAKAIVPADEAGTLFPAGMHVVSVEGHDPADPTPWKAFEEKVCDLAAGTFTPRPAPPVVEVFRSQAKIALRRAGLLAQVKAAVRNSNDEDLQLWFDEATLWRRDNPNVMAIGTVLGLDAAEIDALFVAAAGITA